MTSISRLFGFTWAVQMDWRAGVEWPQKGVHVLIDLQLSRPHLHLRLHATMLAAPFPAPLILKLQVQVQMQVHCPLA